MSCRRVYVLSDGCAGSEKQSLALAHHLSSQVSLFRLQCIHPLWKNLPTIGQLFFAAVFSSHPAELIRSAYACSSFAQLLAPPFPDIVIASGKQTVLACAMFKKMAGSSTFAIQIQHPRCSLSWFDKVITPAHDFSTEFFCNDARLLVTNGALHDINKKSLTVGHPHIKKLKDPMIAVMVGGPTRLCPWSEENFCNELATLIKDCEEKHISIAITCSRRTPPELHSRIQEILSRVGTNAASYFWDPNHNNDNNNNSSSSSSSDNSNSSDGDNPYMSMLAKASWIAITADSISMCSEAAGTGKPIVTLCSSAVKGKFVKFYDRYKALNAVKFFNERLDKIWCYCPVDDTSFVAKEIIRELNKQ